MEWSLRPSPHLILTSLRDWWYFAYHFIAEATEAQRHTNNG